MSCEGAVFVRLSPFYPAVNKGHDMIVADPFQNINLTRKVLEKLLCQL
jgi:hypothetical protein